MKPFLARSSARCARRQAAARLFSGRALVVDGRLRGPALGSETGGAAQIRVGLDHADARGGDLGPSLLHLQAQVGLVEGGERRSHGHDIADVDEALGNLAGDAEAEVAFDAWPHSADVATIANRSLVGDGPHQHRPRSALDIRLGMRLAAGHERTQRERHQGSR